jgi:hypothetical protein
LTYLGEKVVKEKEYLSAMVYSYSRKYPEATSNIVRGREMMDELW